LYHIPIVFFRILLYIKYRRQFNKKTALANAAKQAAELKYKTQKQQSPGQRAEQFLNAF